MSTLRDLAVRLRRLRRRHGLTQEQFAEVAGISYKFYQQIEAGRKKQIWLDTVERLASGFGLAAWQLLAPEEPATTNVAEAPRGRTRRTTHRARSSASRPEDSLRPLAAAEEGARYASGSPRGKRRRGKPGRHRG